MVLYGFIIEHSMDSYWEQKYGLNLLKGDLIWGHVCLTLFECKED